MAVHSSTIIIKELVARYPLLKSIDNEISDAASLLLRAVRGRGKLLICGNGGSAADADHIVGELMKSFCRERPLLPELQQALVSIDAQLGRELSEKLQSGIPAIALTQHTALITAIGNDTGPMLGFAQQVSVLGNRSDLFWGISTSGDSGNVIRAAITARAKGMKVLGMTGKDGGALRPLCDLCICVPAVQNYEIQELHLPIYHALCRILEQELWPGSHKP